ncbi:hypothetical protein F4680DRAFT_431186 [Xylaria scruposa]|nr:hypothetical protein F4680DRAFT_431186 [Xylaria scruposa]
MVFRMFALKHLCIALIGLAGARADMLTGEDINFSVQTYLSRKNSSDPFERVSQGPEFSTSEPPTNVLSLEDLLSQDPIITLTGANTTAETAYYISFLAITRVLSGASGRYSYEHMIPWLKTNQSVADNGYLRIHYGYFDDGTSSTNEPLNATIHVWQQTQDVFNYLTDGFSPESSLTRLWLNDTKRNLPSLDFPRANINFKVRNETGLCRNSVDDQGNPVSVTTVVTSACTPTTSPTASPSASAGSGDGSENPDSHAASHPASAIGWTLMGAALALFI